MQAPNSTAGGRWPLQLFTIAGFTLLEAWRSRLPWLLAGSLALALAAGLFAAELAITESARFRIALIASGVRFAWVFILAVYVISSLTRELNERGFESALSLEVTRTTWVLGKLAGFISLAAVAVGSVCVMLLIALPPLAALAWSASLLFELAIVIAMAQFFTLSLASVPAAAVLSAALYVLTRSIDALVLIASGSPLLAAGPWRDLSRLGTEALSWVLPSLDRFAQTGWLVDQLPAPGMLGLQFVQCLVFVSLLTAAALVDFHRRDL